MSKKQKTAIEPIREDNFQEWYQQVVKHSELAENSPVRGCMVIKPWGYAIWENIKLGLDRKFKETGHVNAYFPLLIPKSFLEKEAEHVDGFAKECAVVTHHRLEAGDDGKLVPAGELEEPYIIRPTSETIIGDAYARWVQSYRDLPIKINQWANVMRWEMRTRLFLRTSEFLWQEGHTAHETAEEAQDEVKQMLEVYREFVEGSLAIPVICGEKTDSERFPGAVETLCIEALMQDGKALQAGTSHFLGQNFAKASGIKFQNREGEEDFAWTTSWGVSTRLIGGLIMTHADDNGMIVPPRVAPTHVVVVPVIPKPEFADKVNAYCDKLVTELRELDYHRLPLEVEVDRRELNASEKSWHWIKKGAPLRIEVGPRDIDKDSVFVAERIREPKDKYSLTREEFVASVLEILDKIQSTLLENSKAKQVQRTKQFDNYQEFVDFFTPKNKEQPEAHGGFADCSWCGEAACEEKVKKELSVTIRCLPFDQTLNSSKCIICEKKATKRAFFAKSY